MNILVELPTWLGDSIMAIPSIENLKRNFPKSNFIFLGSVVAIDLIKNIYSLDKAYFLPKKILLMKKLSYKIKNVDYFISYRSSLRSRIFSLFVHPQKKSYFYSKKKFSNTHQVEKYNEFINRSFCINFLPGEIRLRSSYSEYVEPNQINIAINPGASYGAAKCWPPEYYCMLIESLSSFAQIVLLGGTKEYQLTEKIKACLSKKKVYKYNDLTGKTSISDLINIISNIDLLITGDSGPMHIASAFQTKTISIFGPTNSDDTAQWKNPNDFVLKKTLSCQPCLKRNCPLGHHNCMKLISPEEVYNKARILINL